MLLAIDIGNTHVKAGVYQGASLLHLWKLASDALATTDEYAVWLLNLLRHHDIQPAEITGCAIASVVPQLTPPFAVLSQRYLHIAPLVVRSDMPAGLPVRYNPPSALGVDRLMAALGARHRYGTPLIVITFGTATTFNIISRQGEFIGGAIAPGIATSAEALSRETARLSRIELAFPATPIGRDSETAMQSGVLYGHIALVEGMLRRLSPFAGPDARVVATGGLADLIAPHIAAVDAVDQELTLLGLRLAYEHHMKAPPIPR